MQGPFLKGVHDLLLEIGTEEIPARFLLPVLDRMGKDADSRLTEQGMAHGRIETVGTPRRLVLWVRDLAEKQTEQILDVLGPPKKIAINAQGAFTPAALGFAKNQGVDPDQLETRSTDKGDYLCAVKRRTGRPTLETLPEILPEFLNGLSFPKAMRWNAGQTRFARPIRWILCLYGDQTVSFPYAGIESGNLSYGHRFLAPGPYEVRGTADYPPSCESHFVIIDPAKRRDIILFQMEQAVQSVGGELVRDDALLEEVTGLVEYPVAVCGGFDPNFLKIPREVLMTSMRGHQKYFSIEKEGRLLPYFIGISNMKASDMDGIRQGYERVLRARLSDARFFFDADRKTRLEKRLERLKEVVYLERLGTLWDKTQRLVQMSGPLCSVLGVREDQPLVERAAMLCKADLVTAMVGEFPELQGVMGREYSLLDGESPVVATAIYEHYVPRSSGDALPATVPGMVLALADRIDNLVGCFSLELIPSGSNDPYALRRQAIGILNILTSRQGSASLSGIFRAGMEVYGEKIPKEKREALLKHLLAFLQERAEILWQSDGIPYDTVRTVLSTGLEDPCRDLQKIVALDAIRKESGFEALMVSYKRAVNILQRAGLSKDAKLPEIQQERLIEIAERELYQAIDQSESRVTAAIAQGQFQAALQALAGLRASVDLFFEKVMVMDTDPVLKENRLGLLHRIQVLFNRYGDFSQIVVEGKKE